MFAKKITTKGNTENYENENIGGENYEVTVYFNRSAHSHFKILVYFFVCVFVMTILGSCTYIHCYVGGGSLLENLSQAFDDDYYITSIKTFCHMHTHTHLYEGV